MVDYYSSAGCNGPNESKYAICKHTQCAINSVTDNQMEILQFSEIPTHLLGKIKTDQLPFSDKEYIISAYTATLY